jgi:hypothetical protein
MRGLLPVVLWLLVWLTPAISESVTDNDLYAAYCVGVLKAEYAPPSSYFPKPDLDMEMKRLIEEADRQLQQERANRLNRFQRYLAARGYLTNTSFDHLTRLQIAISQGESDAKQCSSHLARFLRCLNECNNNNEAQCFGKCKGGKMPSCQSSDRCNQPDALPF